MSDLIGRIHSFETFALVDGPGVRCAVFLHGCNLRCKYCHNPDTWYPCKSLTLMTPEELAKKLLRYRPYWKNNGGVTFSGGEPLLQMEFVTEVFKLLKKEGVHTCIDTAGQPFRADDAEWLTKFDELLAVTDLVMLDFKEMDDEKHKALTGHTNKNIFAMAKYMSDKGQDMWIRHVLVPDLTDDEQGLRDMADYIATLDHVQRVEILPYHILGKHKWENLGMAYPLDGVPTPKEDAVKKAEELLRVADYQGYQNK